jgi:NAD(P)-dependent dehydrogenase (short-subunit alcohol dehydrogenase family)
MSLSGKTLFVTGASRGIGLAIALRAARDGANVAIAAKTAEPHKHLPGTIYTAAKEIEDAGGKALPLIVDVRDEANVLEAVEKTVAAFGGIDICVNNASAIQLTGTEATDMKRYDLMQQINARGTFLTSKACIPHLKRASNPHVLMLSPPLDIARVGSGPTSPTPWPSSACRCASSVWLKSSAQTASPSTRSGHAPASPRPRSSSRSAATTACASAARWRSWPTPPTPSSRSRRANSAATS